MATKTESAKCPACSGLGTVIRGYVDGSSHVWLECFWCDIPGPKSEFSFDEDAAGVRERAMESWNQWAKTEGKG